MDYVVWVQVEEIDDEEGHFEKVGDPDEFARAKNLEEAQKIAMGIFSQAQELEFWRKTAAELFGLTSQDVIEEHLSEKQQQLCAAALQDVVAEGLEDEPTPPPTTSLPPPESWYTWCVLATVEGEERLLVPWSDPHKYEFAFDFIYKTPEEAREGLKTMGAEDDAHEQGWILCKKTLVSIERIQDEPTPGPLPQTMPSSEDIYRERAREFFRAELDENDWDIDDEPQVSESNEGAYVAIWRWFPAEEDNE